MLMSNERLYHLLYPLFAGFFSSCYMVLFADYVIFSCYFCFLKLPCKYQLNIGRRPYRNYTQESMDEALRCIKVKQISICAASINMYGILQITLIWRLHSPLLLSLPPLSACNWWSDCVINTKEQYLSKWPFGSTICHIQSRRILFNLGGRRITQYSLQ